MQTKICTKCTINKELSEFYYRKDNNKYRNECISCHKNNRDLYRKNNRDEILKKKRVYGQKYRKTKEYKILDAKYRSDPEYNKRHNIACKKYYNKIKIKIFKHERLRRLSDIDFRIRVNLRSRLRSAIKGQSGKKAYKSIKLLGCTIKNVKIHIEQQFVDGMSWDNYGLWEIDHIIPCASFDLTKPEEQKKCFNYTNLQPLWKIDNRTKSNKIIK